MHTLAKPLTSAQLGHLIHVIMAADDTLTDHATSSTMSVRRGDVTVLRAVTGNGGRKWVVMASTNLVRQHHLAIWSSIPI